MFLWSYVFTINQEKTSENELQKVVVHLTPTLLPKCIEINVPKLSLLLRNYKYKVTDVGNFLGGQKTKFRKTRKHSKKT